MNLRNAHEGLEPATSFRHMGLHLNDLRFGSKSCGTFHERPADYKLGEETACVLTAMTSQGEVSQMCFDPQQPESMTLKKTDSIALEFKADGKPVSIIVKDPKKLGLNVDPDQKKVASMCDVPSPKPSLSLWSALKMWWNQETPCGESIGSKEVL